MARRPELVYDLVVEGERPIDVDTLEDLRLLN
jgi:hypothetical protein